MTSFNISDIVLIMKVHENILLKDYSWIKIGGSCKKFIEVENTEELKQELKRNIDSGNKFDVIGWSCNTLFSDNGIDSTLIRIKSKEILTGIDKLSLPQSEILKVDTRHVVYKDKKITSGFDEDDINYEEFDGEELIVKADAGVGLSFLINDLIDKSIVGLQFFSGIPSSVGAAALNNIHGGPKSFSDFVYAVEIVDSKGESKILNHAEMNFDYDYSILQHGDSTIISVYLLLRYGDKNRARNAAVEWTKRKSSQPKNSLGSAFHNLTRETQEELGFPTTGIGYLLEHKLKLSGFRIGDIMIPEQTSPDQIQVNKNIIVNLGNGTAEDYLAVLNKIWDEANKEFGIKLKTEIHFKGFDFERIKKFFG